MAALIRLASGVLGGWLAGNLMTGRDCGVTGNPILAVPVSLARGFAGRVGEVRCG